MAFPLFALVAAAAVSAHSPHGWRPTPAQVGALEARVVMPPGATGPLVSYERYYSGEVRGGRRVILGELVHIATPPVSPPVLKIVRAQDMPALADFGCAVIRFEYDVDAHRLSAARCGGETPPPPR